MPKSSWLKEKVESLRPKIAIIKPNSTAVDKLIKKGIVRAGRPDKNF